MALQQTREQLNGLQFLIESSDRIAKALSMFGESHKVCVSSNLFSNTNILKIDQCAVDFRQLSGTVEVATGVSEQWLKKVIDLFENIENVEDQSKILVLLGKQARSLAICFRLIAAWGRDLSGRLHSAKISTAKEAEEFKRGHQLAYTLANDDKLKADKSLKSAKNLRETSESTANTWKFARKVLAIIPVSLIITQPGVSLSQQWATDALEAEQKAKRKLEDSIARLNSARIHQEKAEVVYTYKIVDLYKDLCHLEI